LNNRALKLQNEQLSLQQSRPSSNSSPQELPLDREFKLNYEKEMALMNERMRHMEKREDLMREQLMRELSLREELFLRN
jgi:hypothetical protein